MNDVIVRFKADGCFLRIVKGSAKDWEGKPNVFINPDLSLIRAIPPHKWKMSDMRSPRKGLIKFLFSLYFCIARCWRMRKQ